MLTILADHNIAHLSDYFNESVLGVPINLMSMAGRDITAEVLVEHQPHALLIRSVTSVNKALLSDNSSVQFVGSATIGTDHVDMDYLSKRGIAFANASGCSKHSVAQYAITAILTLRPQFWHQSMTLGIIGLGNIGSTLADYANDMGWQVLGYDPFLKSSRTNNATFEQVLKQSDVISLHVPLTTPQQSPHPTYHLIDANAINKMPADTMLINTARGAVVNKTDLLKDIATTDRTVVLDVFEHEPVVSEELLNQLAIATPHIAGYTLEGKLRGTQRVFEAFVDTFAKRLNITNPPTINDLLPPNPYHWQALLSNPEKLAEFYDIMADDAMLRRAVNDNSKRVEGTVFDELRKAYQLRREWVMD